MVILLPLRGDQRFDANRPMSGHHAVGPQDDLWHLPKGAYPYEKSLAASALAQQQNGFFQVVHPGQKLSKLMD